MIDIIYDIVNLKKTRTNFNIKSMNVYSLLKLDNFKVVSIYFILLFIIDYSSILDINNENVYRRILHMFRRRDPLNYSNKLKPFCKSIKGFIDKDDIKKLQLIKNTATNDFPWFSRKNTSTLQYNQMSYSEQTILDTIAVKVKEKYETEIGKKLYLWEAKKYSIYTYHGNNSYHLWHVDPRNIDTIYNIIVCIDRKGDISPFMYKDLENNIHTIDTNIGDGILFNGGTTIHQIPPNNDPNSIRKVLSIAMTTDPTIIRNTRENMCTFMEGGNNYKNVILLILGIFIINIVCGSVSKLWTMSYSFIIVLTILSLTIANYVPILNLPMGTGRQSGVKYNILFLAMIITLCLSVKGGILFGLYFILSDVLFKKNWMEYD